MGDDSHFVLHFSSLFSVGMYICSVLQMQALLSDYAKLQSENRDQKLKIAVLEEELQKV